MCVRVRGGGGGVGGAWLGVCAAICMPHPSPTEVPSCPSNDDDDDEIFIKREPQR